MTRPPATAIAGLAACPVSLTIGWIADHTRNGWTLTAAVLVAAVGVVLVVASGWPSSGPPPDAGRRHLDALGRAAARSKENTNR